MQPRSVFHSTTIKGGKKVPDKHGLHVTVEAGQKLPDGSATQTEKCHIYIDGFDPKRKPSSWYDNVTVKRVRWMTERGSSHSQSSGSRAGPSKPSKSGKDAARGTWPDGWYHDSALTTGLRERYFQDGAWTEYTR